MISLWKVQRIHNILRCNLEGKVGKCVFFARVAGDIDRPIAPQINQRSHGQPYPAGRLVA